MYSFLHAISVSTVISAEGYPLKDNKTIPFQDFPTDKLSEAFHKQRLETCADVSIVMISLRCCSIFQVNFQRIYMRISYRSPFDSNVYIHLVCIKALVFMLHSENETATLCEHSNCRQMSLQFFTCLLPIMK